MAISPSNKYAGLPAITSGIKYGGSIVTPQTISPATDLAWGGFTPQRTGQNPYFQYYFSGQDIIVTIDGTQSDPDFGYLPIMDLGFSIAQSKLAIYGYSDYVYSAVARGARQVAVRMTLATRYPRYLTNLLVKVAQNRNAQTTQYSNLSATQDDQNIIQFWGIPGAINPVAGGNGASQTPNLYQEHPPFDIIITYGIQDTSVNGPATLSQVPDIQNDVWFLDTNERLTVDSANLNSTIVLTNCEILKMSTQYDTSGRVVTEMYDMFANDIIEL